MRSLTIVRPGILTTIQDLGRWGLQSKGMPVCGAMDDWSHRAANRLVGNDENAATLEVTLVGPHVQFDDDAFFAVTGAEFRASLDDAAIAMNTRVYAKAGSVLTFGARGRGARAYLAVAGGVNVPQVLGSRSTHLLTRMGGYEGRALKAGDRIPIGEQADAHDAIAPRFAPGVPVPLPSGGARLRVVGVDARLASGLTSQRFRVSPQSNRMGYRLEGGGIDTGPAGELTSAGVPIGAVQVPPMGQPILLMNDHATTGGYAIAAAVIAADLRVAGQLAPGDWIEFEACTLDAADEALRRQEAAFGAR